MDIFNGPSSTHDIIPICDPTLTCGRFVNRLNRATTELNNILNTDMNNAIVNIVIVDFILSVGDQIQHRDRDN